MEMLAWGNNSFINSRTAIAGAIIGLLLFFFTIQRIELYWGAVFFTTRKGVLEKSFFNQFYWSEFWSGKWNTWKNLEWFCCWTKWRVERKESGFFNSRTAIAGANIDLLLFLFCVIFVSTIWRHNHFKSAFCSFAHAISTEVRVLRHFSLLVERVCCSLVWLFLFKSGLSHSQRLFPHSEIDFSLL